MSNPKTRCNISIFIVIVMIGGWIGVVIDKYLPEQQSENTLGMGLWLIIPLLAIIILRTFFEDGWKDAGLRLNFKNYIFAKHKMMNLIWN